MKKKNIYLKNIARKDKFTMKYIHVKYFSVLISIILIFLAVFYYMDNIVKNLSNDSEMLNIAGKQRMYSQRLQLLAYNYLKYKDKNIKNEFEITKETFKKNNLIIHRYIENIENNFLVSQGIDFQFKNKLNNQFYIYINYLNKLFDEKNINKNNFEYKLFLLGNDFLYNMDKSVSYIELYSKSKINKLKINQIISVIFLMIIIIIQFIFVFLPIFKQLKQEIKLKQKSYDNLIKAQNKIITQEKIASLGALSAGIAHEIQNPINLINNSANIIIDFIKNDLPNYLEKFKPFKIDELDYFREDMELVAKSGEIILSNGNKADSIIKSMLLLSSEGTPEFKLIDINELVEASFKISFRTIITSNPFPIETDIKLLKPELAKVWLYPHELSRALNNILENSFYALKIKFNTQENFKPKIAIALNITPDYDLIIEIEDNGIGISDEIKDKIINPFFTTKPTGEGVGLGLSMVNDIIRIHNGELKVISKENVFTKIIIIIPKNIIKGVNISEF